MEPIWIKPTFADEVVGCGVHHCFAAAGINPVIGEVWLGFSDDLLHPSGRAIPAEMRA